MEENLRAVLGWKGERGYSAYEIAVQNGFEGTEKDWLAQLGTSSHFSEDKKVIVATAGQSSFDIPESYVTGSLIDVYIEGRKLTVEEYTVDEKINLIGFTLDEGAVVEIVTLIISTNNLPIVERIAEDSTNDTVPSTKAVYNITNNLETRFTLVEEQNTSQTSRIGIIEESKLDKNSNESITYAMLAQDVKEQMTGGNTAVVGTNSVNTTNIVDGSITQSKLSETLQYQIAKNSAFLEGELLNVDFDTTTLNAEITYSTGFLKLRLNETGSPIKIKLEGAKKIIPNNAYLVINLDEYTTYNAIMTPIVYESSSGESALFNGNYLILFSNDYGYFGGLMAEKYRKEIEFKELKNDLQKTILKGNPLLLGSILNKSYNPNTNAVTVTYDRSYLLVQNVTGSPLYNIIPSGTITLGYEDALIVKVSDLTTDGTEVTPIHVDSTFSKSTLFNDDYIVLLSNFYGRIGGLFVHNTMEIASQDDTQVYLQVNNSTSITLLKKCSESNTSYLGFNFNRTTASDKNGDIWRLFGLGKYTRKDTTFTSDEITFVTTGEMEAAIKIEGASDFVGGSIHGYEKTKTLEIYIDGKLIDASIVGTYAGKNITINRTSEMYDYGTTDLFADHNCIYEFTNEGLVLSQYLDFKLSKTLNRSYLGMYPVARKIDTNYVSNKAVFFPTLENVDVYEGHTNYAQRTDVNSVLLTNKDEEGYNFIAKFEVLEQKVPALKINISDAEQYNKIYPAICEDTYNLTAGEKWNIKTKYSFEYKGIN